MSGHLKVNCFNKSLTRTEVDDAIFLGHAFHTMLNTMNIEFLCAYKNALNSTWIIRIDIFIYLIKTCFPNPAPLIITMDRMEVENSVCFI